MGEQCANSVRTMFEKKMDPAPFILVAIEWHILSASIQFHGRSLSMPYQLSFSSCFVLWCCCMFVGVSPIYRYARRRYRWFNNLIFSIMETIRRGAMFYL